MWNYQHVRDYLAICRAAFSATAEGRRVRLSWAGRSLDAEGWRAEFRRALHRRINAKTAAPTGRKHDPDYQIRLVRDAQRVQNRVRGRVRIYQFETPEVRARFSHLLSGYDD